MAPGGRLVIYAPHIDEISFTWGRDIQRVGYHTCEYYLKQMERYADTPQVVLAHCALVKGSGSFSNGEEHARIEVVLATGIPRESGLHRSCGDKSRGISESGGGWDSLCGPRWRDAAQDRAEGAHLTEPPVLLMNDF